MAQEQNPPASAAQAGLELYRQLARAYTALLELTKYEVMAEEGDYENVMARRRDAAARELPLLRTYYLENKPLLNGEVCQRIDAIFVLVNQAALAFRRRQDRDGTPNPDKWTEAHELVRGPLHEQLAAIEELLRTENRADSPTEQGERNVTEPSLVARAILFQDVAGWSNLTAPQIYEYVSKALPQIESLLSGAIHKNTWGDAIVAVFDGATSAATAALKIRDFFRNSTPTATGIATGLQCRIALHLGEVMVCDNPLIGRPDFFGSAVHLAARLEPVTPKGHVLCSAAFAGALREVEEMGPRAHPAGPIALPKDFGTIEAFVVTGNNEPDPQMRPENTVTQTTRTSSPGASIQDRLEALVPTIESLEPGDESGLQNVRNRLETYIRRGFPNDPEPHIEKLQMIWFHPNVIRHAGAPVDTAVWNQGKRELLDLVELLAEDLSL